MQEIRRKDDTGTLPAGVGPLQVHLLRGYSGYYDKTPVPDMGCCCCSLLRRLLTPTGTPEDRETGRLLLAE